MDATTFCEFNVGICDRYGEMGKSDIALKFYKKSLAIDEEKYGKDHPKVRHHPSICCDYHITSARSGFDSASALVFFFC